MKVWSFEKQAGLILDQQDDPGVGWESEIEPHWPSDVSAPSIGTSRDESDCIARLKNGHTKIARYPTGTPEDALASSMYFLRFGVPSIEKEAHKQIGESLKHARKAFQVEIPDGFLRHVKTASESPPTRKEVYADDSEEYLPVTTPRQCKGSKEVFEKHASRWPADERLAISKKLKKAADHHGLEVDIPYADVEFQKEAALDRLAKRIEVANGIDGYADYISEINKLKKHLTDMSDYDKLLEKAAELEQIDRAYDMDVGWGDYYPDPVDTLVEPKPEPLEEFAKEANQDKIDWSKIDRSDLEGVFEDDLVEKIASAPEDIGPTLPLSHKRVIKQQIDS